MKNTPRKNDHFQTITNQTDLRNINGGKAIIPKNAMDVFKGIFSQLNSVSQ